MLEETINLLTEMLIKQDFKDKQKGKEEKIVLTKKEIIRHSIRLIKLVKNF